MERRQGHHPRTTGPGRRCCARLALAAAIVMTWPLAPGLDRLGRTANSGDARVSVWNVAWVAHALLADPADLFDANIFHPHRNTLAFSEANLVAGVIALPAWWLTRNPDTAHNVVVAVLVCGVGRHDVAARASPDRRWLGRGHVGGAVSPSARSSSRTPPTSSC